MLLMATVAGHLPWGWFALFAAVDLCLAAALIIRRLRGRRAPRVPNAVTATDVLILWKGWWVPRLRTQALRMRGPQQGWAWPVHREPLRRFE